ncbi:alpha/beta hydrolase [Micromonospora sp. NPDC018662]|uniref:alpha/beta hydrolase n=1 Tax=Micromonospora sp. NPDC018662 TaxID=3364238 RepID=UPI00378805CA
MSRTEYFELPGAFGMLRGVIHHASAEVWVIIVHGYFSSNRVGPYRLYFELAEALRRRGVTVVRMDLSGMGESDGRIEDIRFAHHVSDFELLQRTLRANAAPTDLHVVAHCAGCHVALAAQRPDNLRSLSLIAPFIPGDRGFEGVMFTRTQWEQLRETGSTLRKGWYCHRSFFDSTEVLQRPFDAALRRMTTLIYAGEDEMTPVADSERWANERRIRRAGVSSADHNFTARAVRDRLFDLVSRTVTDAGAG